MYVQDVYAFVFAEPSLVDRIQSIQVDMEWLAENYWWLLGFVNDVMLHDMIWCEYIPMPADYGRFSRGHRKAFQDKRNQQLDNDFYF